MKHQERKYKVNSFAGVIEKLNALGADKSTNTSSVHYYAEQAGDDVVKLVEYATGYEIHCLEAVNGNFILRDKIPVSGKEAGLKWLKDKGFKRVGVVTMDYTDYTYQGDIIGLYTLNDSLLSVILDFPEDAQQTVAQALGLEHAETIAVPYNKYLEHLNKLKLIEL
jgi:hypothetical protein